MVVTTEHDRNGPADLLTLSGEDLRAVNGGLMGHVIGLPIFIPGPIVRPGPVGRFLDQGGGTHQVGDPTTSLR